MPVSLHWRRVSTERKATWNQWQPGGGYGKASALFCLLQKEAKKISLASLGSAVRFAHSKGGKCKGEGQEQRRKTDGERRGEPHLNLSGGIYEMLLRS
jgi:hypothetical protein